MSPYKICDLRGESIYSTSEAVEAAGLNWEVDRGDLQVQCYDRTEGKFVWNKLDNHKGIYRKDTGRPLGNCVVGSGFELIQNNEAFRCFDKIIQSTNAQYVSGGYMHNGSSAFLQCRLPYSTHLKGDDTVERYLLIAQGHTGQQALTMRFTHIRPSCYNTLISALRDTSHSFSIKHTRQYKNKLDSAIKFMQAGLGHLAATERKFRAMTMLNLSTVEQQNFLKLAYERQIDEPLDEWRKWAQLEPIFAEARGGKDSEGTLFHPLMVLTEYEDHAAPVHKPRGVEPVSPLHLHQQQKDLRQIRSMFGANTVSRKINAFMLADDVLKGNLDLRTGRRVKSGIKAIAALSAATVATIGHQLMT
jgi:phage/plasmid-like protein (TIGR03299 family)